MIPLVRHTLGRHPRAHVAARALIAAGAVVAWPVGQAWALPAFAVQTGQHCNACHVGGFGPQLTPFGRTFKLRGYTTRAVDFNVPLTGFAVASYVKTAKDQSSPPAPGYSVNDNATLDQASLFLAGGWGHVGAFIQTTYDGVKKTFHWDNLDVRATTAISIKKNDVVLGLNVNNSPTVQDVFNTLPAWGFPYTTSTLAPAPGAAPLIGALAQNTLGVSTYAWINSKIYLEVAGYQSPGENFLRRAGIDPLNPGAIRGTAPYARVAYQKNYGDKNFELGAFGLWTALYPGRDRSTGQADHYTDLGLDASFQYFAPNKDVFTLNGRYVHEGRRWSASQPLGLVLNPTGELNDLHLDASYYWRDKIGFSVGGFDTWGSSDPVLYAANRTFRPDSSGLVFQLDATPFGNGSPLGDRFNTRFGVQYFVYGAFNGAGHNFDGANSNASDNNTVRVFAWVYY